MLEKPNASYSWLSIMAAVIEPWLNILVFYSNHQAFNSGTIGLKK